MLLVCIPHGCFVPILSELPRVRWVLPDSYLDVKNKDYGGKNMMDFVGFKTTVVLDLFNIFFVVFILFGIWKSMHLNC